MPFLGATRLYFYEYTVGRIFAPKFYHDKRDPNFLKFLSYVGEYGPDNSHCEFPQIGRKFYEYKKKAGVSIARIIQPTDLDWPFPEYISKILVLL